MDVDIPLEKFEYCPPDILERLYAESKLEPAGSTEEYMALPLPDSYIVRLSKKSEEVVEEIVGAEESKE